MPNDLEKGTDFRMNMQAMVVEAQRHLQAATQVLLNAAEASRKVSDVEQAKTLDAMSRELEATINQLDSLKRLRG